MPANFGMPFFYSSLSLIWTYYLVDEALVTPYLADTRLSLSRFTDPECKNKALVSLNFQNYAALLGMAISATNEIEFNLHVCPTAQAERVPPISLGDYLRGQEQTKLFGEFRLHVPADNAIAVDAGISVFGERKFLTTFSYNVPSPNNPATQTWSYTVFDPSFGGDASRAIYTLQADLRQLAGTTGNGSPLTLYSMLPGGPNRPPGGRDMRLIGSRWNMFGLYQEYLEIAPADQARFSLSIGKSDHPMAVDARRIFGRAPVVRAVRVFVSPPAAAENRPYYVT
jgi:hypothetical protein